jgi:hypothetical protein
LAASPRQGALQPGLLIRIVHFGCTFALHPGDRLPCLVMAVRIKCRSASRPGKRHVATDAAALKKAVETPLLCCRFRKDPRCVNQKAPKFEFYLASQINLPSNSQSFWLTRRRHELTGNWPILPESGSLKLARAGSRLAKSSGPSLSTGGRLGVPRVLVWLTVRPNGARRIGPAAHA